MREQHVASDFATVVAGVLDLDPGQVADEDGPASVAQWTSRKHIELIVRLEEVYQVRFEHDEIFGIRSFGDLREALRRKGVPQ